MNAAAREAILRGVASGAETHDAFRFREVLADGLSAVDVFGLIEDLQIPLAFRAFDALLGACVRISSSEVGILVTTQRDLHMQRFTAAHELGHFILEHEGSLDREIAMPADTQGRDAQEIEADAFASEFLMPKWLVQATAKRRSWWEARALRTPQVVYQLSLRLAVSYEATCWGLASHEFINHSTARSLIGNGGQLKRLKQESLGGVILEDPWADVWHLKESDNGARLEAGPNDLFVLELEEPAAAGFRWDTTKSMQLGFQLLEDTSSIDESVVGGPASRRFILTSPPPGEHELVLPLDRSFARDSNPKTFRVSISTVGTRRDDSPNEPTPTMH